MPISERAAEACLILIAKVGGPRGPLLVSRGLADLARKAKREDGTYFWRFQPDGRETFDGYELKIVSDDEAAAYLAELGIVLPLDEQTAKMMVEDYRESQRARAEI